MPKDARKKTVSARNRILIPVALAGLFIGLGLFAAYTNPDDSVKITLPNGSVVDAQIAATIEEQTRGLSGRTNLEGGMLFVFERQESYGIWMKDMKFAIDIIWLDENREIVTIQENATPESYPKTFFPSRPSLYVLEVNSGTVSGENLSVGQTLSW